MFNEEVSLSCFRQHIKDSCLSAPFPLQDEFLIVFLRARKYDSERAFKALKNYLKMVEQEPDLMKNLTETALRNQLDKRLQVVCKDRDSNGRRVFIFRAGQWNPNETTLDDIFRCNMYYLQRLASEPDTQKNGVIAIVDLQSLGLCHARQFSPGHAKKIACILTGAFPLSFHAIHIVNQNWMVSMLMSVIWPLLSSKIQKRIHYHGNCWSSLHKFVHATYLPQDYGGLQERLSQWNNNSTDGLESDINLFDF